MSKIVCFGEVLWDVFPNHRKVGGAPLNVALRLNSFNHRVHIISSVGQDEDGNNLIEFIKSKGIKTDHIQRSTDFKTGLVLVNLDDKGSANYDISFPVAWDYIKLPTDLEEIIIDSDAFIFGSLVARNIVSRESLFELLKIANFKVFDVNLRPPHYTMDVLVKLMEEANFIKFNVDELIEICKYLSFHSEDIESNIKFISNKTNTQNICVTLGKDGAMLFLNNDFFKNSGYAITVKDTVGAGDSFLASLINKLLENNHPKEALDFACAVGALVAQKDGANPIILDFEIENLIKS